MMKIGEIRLCAGEHARRTRFAKTDRVSSKFQRRFTNKIGRFGNDGREFRNPRGSFRPNRCRREPSATSFVLLKSPPPPPIRQTQISRFAQYLKNTSSRLWILWLLSREKEGDSTRLDSPRGSVKVFSIDLHTRPFPSYCVLYTPCPSLFIQRIFYYAVRDARRKGDRLFY